MIYAPSIVQLHLWTGYLWIIFLVVWIAAAWGTKKIVQQESGLSRLAYGLILWFAAVLTFVPHFRWLPSLDASMFPVTVGSNDLGFLCVICGLAFCFWARFTLGRNWSGTATVKQGHTLMTRGPYGIVRHPIYSGLLLMLLGGAMEYGLWRHILALPIFVFGFWLKAQTEERFMMEQFGPQYVDYRRRVCALVPFLF